LLPGLMMGFKMIGKIILPVDLTVIPLAADISFWFSLSTLPFLIILLFYSRQKRKDYLFFGAAWFAVFFIPPLMFSNGTSYFEHRFYLPLIGFLIILSEVDFVKNLNWRHKKVVSFAALGLIVLAIPTFFHSQNFRDPLTFWQAAVKGSPHSLPAHVILGNLYSENARWPEAEQELLEAIKLNPQEPITHYNLGVVYLNEDKKIAAAEEFKRELTVNPGYYKALANLGDLAYQSGQKAEALQYWRAALISNPNDERSAQRLESLRESSK